MPSKSWCKDCNRAFITPQSLREHLAFSTRHRSMAVPGSSRLNPQSNAFKPNEQSSQSEHTFKDTVSAASANHTPAAGPPNSSGPIQARSEGEHNHRPLLPPSGTNVNEGAGGHDKAIRSFDAWCSKCGKAFRYRIDRWRVSVSHLISPMYMS